MKIYRFESPLYFANAALFKEELYKCTSLDPLERKKFLAKLPKKPLTRTPSDTNVESSNEVSFFAYYLYIS